MTCDPWPVDRSKLPSLPDTADPTYYDALLSQDNAIRIAINMLWALSGRQYGVCETRVRPCTSGMKRNTDAYLWSSSNGGFAGYRYLAWTGSAWRTDLCGCGSSCTTSGPYAAHLPGPVYPDDGVHPITVLVGGDVLDPANWVLEGDVLYRKDRPWPAQNLGRAEGDSCSWSVTYWRGQGVPASVGHYVGTLAAELLLAEAGENCRLPASVRRVSRQGVSMEIDPTSVIREGLTGLIEIDRWISSVNPSRMTQPPTVL